MKEPMQSKSLMILHDKPEIERLFKAMDRELDPITEKGQQLMKELVEIKDQC